MILTSQVIFLRTIVILAYLFPSYVWDESSLSVPVHVTLLACSLSRAILCISCIYDSDFVIHTLLHRQTDQCRLGVRNE